MALAWQIIDLVRISSCAAGGSFWTLAQEFVPGSRLLRIRVVAKDHDGNNVPALWRHSRDVAFGPDGDPVVTERTCGPDGDPAVRERTGMLCTGAACGALIGKIGGSTGDIPDSAGGSSGPYAGKKVFAVGKECILSLTAATDGGPLFLTMNDKPEAFPGHSGDLYVLLQCYPL
jgi:hypothetical protein